MVVIGLVVIGEVSGCGEWVGPAASLAVLSTHQPPVALPIHTHPATHSPTPPHPPALVLQRRRLPQGPALPHAPCPSSAPCTPPSPSFCSADDFHKILTEPESNMIKQQQALLSTENVELIFTGGWGWGGWLARGKLVCGGAVVVGSGCNRFGGPRVWRR